MTHNVTIRINEQAAATIRLHAMETYPRECCGALLGRDASRENAREVLEAMALANQSDDPAGKRFFVAPRDVIAADRAAQSKGLEVVGWYHSHPDHPAKPSRYDRESAWPWYSYIIVTVAKGEAKEMRSWSFEADQEDYVEERIEVGT